MLIKAQGKSTESVLRESKLSLYTPATTGRMNNGNVVRRPLCAGGTSQGIYCCAGLDVWVANQTVPKTLQIQRTWSSNEQLFSHHNLSSQKNTKVKNRKRCICIRAFRTLNPASARNTRQNLNYFFIYNYNFNNIEHSKHYIGGTFYSAGWTSLFSTWEKKKGDGSIFK